MRVVMLNANQLDALALHRVLGGEILRMQIVRDHLRFDSEQAAKMIDAIDVSPPGFVVFQIANVMRHKGTVALHQAKRAFQFGAAGKNRTAGTERHHERTRRVAARSANRVLAPANQSNDRVIGADVNRSVVDQKAIRDSTQPLNGVSAVVERVTKAAIAAGKNLSHTIVASGDIRCDQNVAIARAIAFVYLELAVTGQRDRQALDSLYSRERRRFRLQLVNKLAKPIPRSLDFDHDAARIVAHKAREHDPPGERMHKRAKADSLHDTVDADAQPRSSIGPRSVDSRVHRRQVEVRNFGGIISASGNTSYRATL